MVGFCSDRPAASASAQGSKQSLVLIRSSKPVCHRPEPVVYQPRDSSTTPFVSTRTRKPTPFFFRPDRGLSRLGKPPWAHPARRGRCSSSKSTLDLGAGSRHYLYQRRCPRRSAPGPETCQYPTWIWISLRIRCRDHLQRPGGFFHHGPVPACLRRCIVLEGVCRRWDPGLFPHPDFRGIHRRAHRALPKTFRSFHKIGFAMTTPPSYLPSLLKR